MDITFNSIYTKCRDLSSYEAGRGVVDDALYNLIHINDRDKMVLRPFAISAAESLSALLGFAVKDVEYKEEGDKFVFSFVEDTVIKGNTSKATTQVTEVLTCFVMSKWLENKLTERAQAYAAMFTDLAGALIKRIYKKQAPILT